MGVLGLVCFVGEVDDELGIALDDDAPYPKGDCSSELGEEALVFGDVVGDLVRLALEAQLHDVVELVSSWGSEHSASPHALPSKSTIKVHRLDARPLLLGELGFFLEVFSREGISPLRGEIRQCCALDG